MEMSRLKLHQKQVEEEKVMMQKQLETTTQEVNQLKQDLTAKEQQMKKELATKEFQLNKMHMDFLNEHQRKAVLELQIEAMEIIKVERDMLQLQLKQERDKFLALKKEVDKNVAQCTTLKRNDTRLEMIMLNQEEQIKQLKLELNQVVQDRNEV
jgi:predicted ATPase